MLKPVYKYSRTLISLLQRTTTKLHCYSFYARKHQYYSPLSPMLEKPHSPEITTDARIITLVRIA